MGPAAAKAPARHAAARPRRGAGAADALRRVPFRPAHPPRLVRPGRRQQAEAVRSRHTIAADAGTRADRHRAGRGPRRACCRARPAGTGEPLDRLRPVPLLPGRPRQPVQPDALDGRGRAGRLRHAPAGAACALPGRCRWPGPGHHRGAGLFRRHRLFGGAEVRHAGRGRLGGRGRLRRRGPDGAVGAGRDGPPARHRVRHRRFQAAGRRRRRRRGHGEPAGHARAGRAAAHLRLAASATWWTSSVCRPRHSWRCRRC